jgi:hypothetical protein
MPATTFLKSLQAHVAAEAMMRLCEPPAPIEVVCTASFYRAVDAFSAWRKANPTWSAVRIVRHVGVSRRSLNPYLYGRCTSPVASLRRAWAKLRPLVQGESWCAAPSKRRLSNDEHLHLLRVKLRTRLSVARIATCAAVNERLLRDMMAGHAFKASTIERVMTMIRDHPPFA